MERDRRRVEAEREAAGYAPALVPRAAPFEVCARELALTSLANHAYIEAPPHRYAIISPLCPKNWWDNPVTGNDRAEVGQLARPLRKDAVVRSLHAQGRRDRRRSLPAERVRRLQQPEPLQGARAEQQHLRRNARARVLRRHGAQAGRARHGFRAGTMRPHPRAPEASPVRRARPADAPEEYATFVAEGTARRLHRGLGDGSEPLRTSTGPPLCDVGTTARPWCGRAAGATARARRASSGSACPT
jgi:hypothetical protein